VIQDLAEVAFLSGEQWHNLDFFWTPEGEIGVSDGDYTYEVKTRQLMISEAVLPEIQSIVREARKDWVQGEVAIKDFPRLVSNPRIVAGSPTIRETRIETSVVAYFAQALGVEKVLELYPHLDEDAVLQAMRFEGAQPLAA